MTRIFLTTSLLIAALTLFAQSNAYEQAMEQAVAELQAAEQTRDFRSPANTFERIAQAAPEGEWLPAYYQAYAQLMLAVKAMEQQNPEQLQAHLDKAQIAIEQAKAIAPEEAEVHALQGYIYTGNIWSNPQANGPKFSPKATGSYQKAMQLNPDNPRPHHLMGMHLFFTPSFWGGGPESALPHLKKAEERFTSFEPASSLHPSWGQYFNTELLANAEADEK